MPLNPQYMLAPSIQEVFVDPDTGLPLSGGEVFFYSDVNRSSLKPIYELSGAPSNYTYTQLQNPVTLSAGGTFSDGTSDILPYYYPYDENGDIELYYLVVQNSGGVQKLTRQAYPNFIQQSQTNFDVYNFIRNPQFTSWSNSTTFPNIGLGASGASPTSDFCADDWIYGQNDPGQTIAITQGVFAPSDPSSPPGNPIYFLRYNNTNIGVTPIQVSNNLSQYSDSVQTLAGQTVSFSIYVRGTSSAPINMQVLFGQNFGTGGTPSTPVYTNLLSMENITSSFNQYSATVTIPSIYGKSIGTNGDDSTYVYILFPLNQIAQIDICNVQLQIGDQITPFTEKTFDDYVRGTNYKTSQSLWSTGSVVATISNAAPAGWMMMLNQTIGDYRSVPGGNFVGLQYKALFIMIWNNVPQAWAQLYNSAGAEIARGASAEADWDAFNCIRVPQSLGRVIAQAGTIPSGASTITHPLGEANNTGTRSGSPDMDHIVQAGTQVGQHSHGTTDSSGHSPAILPVALTGGQGLSSGSPFGQFNVTGGITINANSAPVPMDIRQGTLYLNYMIKL